MRRKTSKTAQQKTPVDYQPRPGEKSGIPTKVKVTLNPQYYDYLPTFNVIYDDDALFYTPDYDVTNTHYIEAGLYDPDAKRDEKDKLIKGEPLLYYEHKGLFQDIKYKAGRGEAFNEFSLSARRGINPKTMRGMLDRLEDCELVKRFRLPFSRHFQILVMVCTPFTPEQLEEHGARLLAQIRERKTANLRKLHGKQFPLLRFDKKTIEQCFPGKPGEKQLKEMQRSIEYVHDLFSRSRDEWTHEEFLEYVQKECEEKDVKFSNRLYMCAASLLNLKRDAENKYRTDF